MRQFEERASNIPALKCGAGSTILTAHQLQRIGYGVEIDPGYLAVTLERLSMLGLKAELMQ